MAEDTSQVGRVLAGRYRLLERLGKGGMGAIWKAEHLVLKAPVAVKVIDREIVADEEASSRFMREAQAAAALRSPHVVQIIDYGVDGSLPFIVMELLEGENLAQRIKRQKRLSPADTARIITHVARAVARAHELGVIHRDLKPENVFLIHNEDEEIAKVLDFGVAKIDVAYLGSEGTRTRTGSLLGTPYYMSPEQAQGNKTIDHRSDLWALAVIAFECITGKRPFFSEGLGDLVLQICIRDIPVPSELVPVPLGFDAWFARATQRDPEDRFQSARELAESLRDALGLEGSENFPQVTVSALPSEPLSQHPPSEGSAVALTQDANTILDSEEARKARAEQRLQADGQAATLLASNAPNLEQAQASALQLAPTAEGPALTVQQFGTTQRTIPPKKPGTGTVVLVGGLALVVGVTAGFAFIRSSGNSDADSTGHSGARVDRVQRPQRSASKPSIAATRESEDGTLAASGAEIDADVSEAGAEDEPDATSDAASDAGAQDAAAKASATESTRSDAQAPSTESEGASRKKSGAKASESESSQSESDGGWVKPAWAIPDDELERRMKSNSEAEASDNPYPAP